MCNTTVPYDEDDRFLLGFSDGTLLVGTYNEKLECNWAVAREGANKMDLDWANPTKT